jgi:uncharacterized protein YndB with AHSA1/START domain
MTGQDFTTTFSVDNSPEEAFAAITNVRGWWSAEVEGETERLGDEFTFHVPGVHRCQMKLTEVIPGRRVVWHVSDSWIGFIEDKTEWDDTEIVFDVSDKDGRTAVRFTHVGLVPSYECFAVCSDARASYMTGSLRSLITTGKGDPHRKEDTFDTEVRKHQATKEMAES